MVFFMFVGIASVLYAARNKSESSSIRTSLGAAGALSAVVFAIVTYLFVTNPVIYRGNSLSYTFLFASFFGGLVIYFVHKSQLKKSGLDLSLAFKEIPPE